MLVQSALRIISGRAKKQNKKTGKYAFDLFIDPITRHQLSTLPSVFLSHNCILFREQRTFCWEHRSNGALIPFCSHQKHTVGSYQNINKPHQSPVPAVSSTAVFAVVVFHHRIDLIALPAPLNTALRSRCTVLLWSHPDDVMSLVLCLYRRIKAACCITQ